MLLVYTCRMVLYKLSSVVLCCFAFRVRYGSCCSGTVLYCIAARRVEIISMTEQLLSHIDNIDYDSYLSVN